MEENFFFSFLSSFLEVSSSSVFSSSPKGASSSPSLDLSDLSASFFLLSLEKVIPAAAASSLALVARAVAASSRFFNSALNLLMCAESASSCSTVSSDRFSPSP